jgi:lipoate-protein ligase A
MKILFDGEKDGSFHMQRDRELFSHLIEPTLRFYTFSPQTITYGYFIQPNDHIHDTAKNYFHIAQRPTGGGILFHVGDFSFSLLIPRSDTRFSDDIITNYRSINERVLGVLERLYPELVNRISLHQHASSVAPFCMAEKSACDLLLNGLKVGAAAQRISKKGFLHQCSLFFKPLPWEILKEVIKNEEDVYAMQRTSTVLPIELRRSQELMEALSTAF